MDEMNEEIEANELLDETQRLRHKRDLLTKENEQLKSYLRLRQMESTATCEQLKSEIEQQIEQFEALGDTETNHLETLKSFRSEIEAIQCWNSKIRNKYFSRNASSVSSERLSTLNNALNDSSDAVSHELSEDKTVDEHNNPLKDCDSSISTKDSDQISPNKSSDNQDISSPNDLNNNNSNTNSIETNDGNKSKDETLEKQQINNDLISNSSNSNSCNNSNIDYSIITRSKQKSINTISKSVKRKGNSDENKSKRKKN